MFCSLLLHNYMKQKIKKRWYCVKVFCTYSDTLHIRITHFLSLEIWGSWQGFLSLLSLSSAIHTVVMTDPSKRAKLPHGTIYIHYIHTLVWFTNCAELMTCCGSVVCHSNSWAENHFIPEGPTGPVGPVWPGGPTMIWGAGRALRSWISSGKDKNTSLNKRFSVTFALKDNGDCNDRLERFIRPCFNEWMN